MRTIEKLMIAAVGIVSLFSCVKVLDYDIPDDAKKIVVNGVLSDSDTFKVHIHKSLHVLDRLGIKAIDNALVQLYDGIEIVSEMNQGKNGLYVSGYAPVPGHDYRLQVTVPGMKTAAARCILPAHVPIGQVDTLMTAYESTQYQYYYSNDSNGVTEIKSVLLEINASIIFTDPGEEENYYELEGLFRNLNHQIIEISDTIFGGEIYRYAYSPFIRSSDPVIELCISGSGFSTKDPRSDHVRGEKMLFSDRLINGQNYKLMVSFASIDAANITDSTALEIHLKAVTKDYFVYMQLLEKHLQVKDDPLSEPSQAYTNVQDGLGILGGMSESIYTLNLNHLVTF